MLTPGKKKGIEISFLLAFLGIGNLSKSTDDYLFPIRDYIIGRSLAGLH